VSGKHFECARDRAVASHRRPTGGPKICLARDCASSARSRMSRLSCATMLTLTLPSVAIAQRIASDLEANVVARAGWHVHNNVEQLVKLRRATAVLCPFAFFPNYAGEDREIRCWPGMPCRNRCLVGPLASSDCPILGSVQVLT
jgi:hypothetical protein